LYPFIGKEKRRRRDAEGAEMDVNRSLVLKVGVKRMVNSLVKLCVICASAVNAHQKKAGARGTPG
jgi:hypothetical protein